MIKQASGKIFLSDQRGITEAPEFRRYSTFNFGPYFNEHKMPFSSLYVVNEEIMAGSSNITLSVEKASHIITIPIAGEVNITDLQGYTSMVDVEEIQVNTFPANSSIQLSNSYPDHIIHFLQLWISAETSVHTGTSRLFSFDFNSIENQLTPIIKLGKQDDNKPQYPFLVSIGRFAGRKEAMYTLKNKDSKFFAFVIAGAFEIEGRLIHEKDALALWDSEKIELEALSNHALILVIELIELNKLH